MSVNQKNDKKTPTYRFNAIDVFIIVLVILCVVGIYFRSNIKSWIGIDKDLKEYEISFVVKQIKSSSNQYLTQGNEVYTNNGLYIGAISACSSLPANAYVTNEKGEMIAVTYPEDTYIDVTGTITCKGIQKGDGFYLSGTYLLSPGTVIEARTEVINFTLTITDISEITK